MNPRYLSRISATRTNPISLVIEGVAGLDDPAHLHRHVAFLAQQRTYPDAARRMEKLLLPRMNADRRLVETILKVGISDGIRTFRIGCDFGIVPRISNNRTLETFSFIELVAATNSTKAKHAWTAIHALGFVRSPHGVIPIESSSLDCPGLWPATPAERLALALNLIVRTAMAGERFDSIRLVRP